MLGVIVALPWELRTLSQRRLEPGTCSCIRDDVIVALSGIGPQRARAAAALLVSRGATALLSWGCAAALDDRLRAGSLLLPESVIDGSGESHPVTNEWHRRLHSRLSPEHNIHCGPLGETLKLLTTPAEKQVLARRTGAIATDMESAAQASVARQHGLPFVVVRAALDTAATGLPQIVTQSVDENGKINIGKLAAGFARRPGDWKALLQLGMQFLAARKSLRRAGAVMFEISGAFLQSHSLGTTIGSRE